MKTLFLLVLLFISTIALSQSPKKTLIYFDFDKFKLTKTALFKLDSLSEKIKQSKIITKIEIFAHCDSIGSHKYNDQLSLNRVKEVGNYLINKGIDTSLIRNIQGYGKRKPVTTNKTEHERLLNRRAEIIVYFKNEKKQRKFNDLITKDTKVGDIVKIDGLYFKGGYHTFTPESYQVLQQLLHTMLIHTTLELEIQGHVCCTADDEEGFDQDTHTEDLSVNRAKAVYEYLISKSISPKRLSYKGFGGKHKAANPEITDSDKALNRRVEIKIVKL